MNHVQIEKLLRTKMILINHKRAAASDRINTNDVISIKETVLTSIQSFKQEDHTPEPVIPRKQDADLLASLIIYDEKDFLVINKPYGIASQGGTKIVRHIDGLLDAYAYHYCCNTKLRLVHRLDRETSGVMVIGKTLRATTYFAEQFKQHRMQKTYWAICHNKPDPAHGTIDQPIAKGDAPDTKKDLKQAITHYHMLKSFGRLSLMQFQPQTGRTHQIRIHAAMLHIPILGDHKYGPKTQEKLHLHARSLTLYTEDSARMTFTSDPSPHMADLLADYGVDWLSDL